MFGKPVRYQPIPAEILRNLPFPGADLAANMFQFVGEDNGYDSRRNVALARSLNPSLASFAEWSRRPADAYRSRSESSQQTRPCVVEARRDDCKGRQLAGRPPPSAFNHPEPGTGPSRDHAIAGGRLPTIDKGNCATTRRRRGSDTDRVPPRHPGNSGRRLPHNKPRILIAAPPPPICEG